MGHFSITNSSVGSVSVWHLLMQRAIYILSTVLQEVLGLASPTRGRISCMHGSLYLQLVCERTLPLAGTAWNVIAILIK